MKIVALFIFSLCLTMSSCTRTPSKSKKPESCEKNKTCLPKAPPASTEGRQPTPDGLDARAQQIEENRQNCARNFPDSKFLDIGVYGECKAITNLEEAECNQFPSELEWTAGSCIKRPEPIPGGSRGNPNSGRQDCKLEDNQIFINSKCENIGSLNETECRENSSYGLEYENGSCFRKGSDNPRSGSGSGYSGYNPGDPPPRTAPGYEISSQKPTHPTPGSYAVNGVSAMVKIGRLKESGPQQNNPYVLWISFNKYEYILNLSVIYEEQPIEQMQVQSGFKAFDIFAQVKFNIGDNNECSLDTKTFTFEEFYSDDSGFEGKQVPYTCSQ